MTQEEIIIKTLTDFFEEIKREYRDLKEGGVYDSQKLSGYNDCIWDMKVILKDNHNIQVSIAT